MAWIKRNLFFVIGGAVTILLLATAGFYDYRSWSRNSAAFDKLDEVYKNLKDLNQQKPSPGNEQIDNTKIAKEQEAQVRAWVDQAGNYFQPIDPIPNSTNGVTGERYAGQLRKTIDQLQREAENAAVVLPPRYGFSFEAQRSLVKFAAGSLDPLAAQLGEVKTLSEILFAARVNSLDSIQRVRVSDDDTLGPASDYIDEHPATNNLAVLTPYVITFRSFSAEISRVLSGLASSQHGFIVKGINVQPAGTAAAAATVNGPEGMPMQPPPAAPLAAMPQSSRNGLQTVLNEQLLRVTIEVEVVKLLPKT